MSPKTAPEFILGTHVVGDVVNNAGIAHFDDGKDVLAFLDAFYGRGYKHLDTAQNYPGSEERLGKASAGTRFAIDTKVKSGTPGDHEPAKLEASIKDSLDKLQVPSVEILYLHWPDRQTPFEDTAKAMNDAFAQGKFKKLGLSNYSAEEVRKYVAVCEEKGYVKPSVYQGHYNAIVRGGEKELFPLLREKNIAFYAYSPAAAGLFRAETEASPHSGRFSDKNPFGAFYNMLYGKPLVQSSVAAVRAAAQRNGISGHAAAVRWTAYHSALDGKYGDALLFSASSIEQLNSTLDALEAGPLPDDLAEPISAVYASLEGTGPPYCL